MTDEEFKKLWEEADRRDREERAARLSEIAEEERERVIGESVARKGDA